MKFLVVRLSDDMDQVAHIVLIEFALHVSCVSELDVQQSGAIFRLCWSFAVLCCSFEDMYAWHTFSHTKTALSFLHQQGF